MKADNYAKAIDPVYNSSYYAALWEKTGALTQNQIQDATVDLANLWFTAAVGIVSNSFIPLRGFPKAIVFNKVTVGNLKDTTITITNHGAVFLIFSALYLREIPFPSGRLPQTSRLGNHLLIRFGMLLQCSVSQVERLSSSAMHRHRRTRFRSVGAELAKGCCAC